MRQHNSLRSKIFDGYFLLTRKKDEEHQYR